MKCTDCVYYEICKNLIYAGFAGINENFPDAGGCEVFSSKHEEKVKEDEKKMQPAVSTALQAILADRGYKVFEIKTFSGSTFVGTNIQIKFNESLLTKCVYCNDGLFSTIQNISEVKILFFS